MQKYYLEISHGLFLSVSSATFCITSVSFDAHNLCSLFSVVKYACGGWSFLSAPLGDAIDAWARLHYVSWHKGRQALGCRVIVQSASTESKHKLACFSARHRSAVHDLRTRNGQFTSVLPPLRMFHLRTAQRISMKFRVAGVRWNLLGEFRFGSYRCRVTPSRYGQVRICRLKKNRSIRTKVKFATQLKLIPWQ
jgi:hypothetical protein